MNQGVVPPCSSIASLSWVYGAWLLQGADEEAGFDLAAFWTSELLVVDGQPITVRKIVYGVLLLVVGYAASRALSKQARRLLPSRVRLSEGARAAVETVAFYLLLAVFSLSALGIAGVPLTAFTLLGGAAAIGIGFGSQAIINNFISGIILLVERPMQVGDLVQVGDLYGTVERMGMRSTLVRTGESIDIIVPNSSFLEQNVINWTLTATEVRASVTVGVAYGSDTRRVHELMLQAAAEDEACLEKPEPFVLFMNFGDSSLDFEVFFWISVNKLMDLRRAQSRVRMRIDDLFRVEGITIAFPQRDVHLGATSAIDVRLVEPKQGGAQR